MQGRDIEVVQVEGGSYLLDKDALQSILLRPQVKDLPVVVVSVAGAFRKGKSFLLNFFLRYINAPLSQQLDGTWLGAEDAHLEGFPWCGGRKRKTTGIVIWSEPAVTTLQTGEKVAIILMDTQGTFDSSSTVKDCSTIFALSTLLSSVQIYNLSQIIGEDNLQHLQLFTEYGNLLKDKDSKAFQVLEFLVRDWPNDENDYPYGYDGGKEYIKEVFQINKDMDEQLQNLRKHIRSSFELISCFLLPHPGLVASSSQFKGQIKELRPEFLKHIRELTSHIFGPTRMKPKEIGGQKVTASSLFKYFNSYVKVFNSDELPTPKSIMEATAEAALLSAFEEARGLYENSMEAECGSSQPSLSAHDLEKIHEYNAVRATALFTNKKNMGDVDKHLQKLQEELQKRLQQFVELNIAKVQKTLIDAKELYESKTGLINSEQPLCVHPLDLEEIHLGAFQAVVNFFDSKRRNISGEEDKDRADFIMSIEKQYGLMRMMNDQSNKMIVTELHLEYWQTMERKCRDETPSESELKRIHEEALANAVEGLESRRNQSNYYDTDEFKSKLIEMIQDSFDQLREINQSKNKAFLQAAITAYDEHMADAWDPKEVCLHPGDLEEENEKAERKAITKFKPTRVIMGKVHFNQNDDDERILAQVLEARYSEFKRNNDAANETAVTAAVNVYGEAMRLKLCGSIKNLVLSLVLPLVGKSPMDIYHGECKEEALNRFYKKRRASRSTAIDKFLSDLKERISVSRRSY